MPQSYSLDTMIKAAGIIPLQKQNGSWFVFIIKRNKGFWEFPKGHCDPGEFLIETAERELKEETGLYVVSFIHSEPLRIQYRVQQEKQVFYFLAEVEGEVELNPSEVLEGNWYPLEKAREILTFENTRNLCPQIGRLLLG